MTGTQNGGSAGEVDGWSPWPAQTRTAGPLAGIKVLDLSRVLAGPYAAMLLGDLGADVIKVEHPQGDETRRWGPPFHGQTAVYFLTMNRNKRSITADLADPADLTVVRNLARQADVVIENFRPGSLANYSLDHKSVQEINPSVVYCSITGFGSDGEHSQRGGYDLVAQAMGGMMHITGEPGRPPAKVGVASADLAAGMYATVALLAALHDATSSGRGHHVEVALLDAQVAFLANQAMNWLAGGLDPQPLGSAHPNVVPYQGFETATGYIVVAAGTDQHFEALCQLVGWVGPESNARHTTNAARVEHRAQLIDALTDVFRRRPSEDWLTELDAAGIPCGPVRSVAEVFADRSVNERMVRHVGVAGHGVIPQVASPFRIDGRNSTIDLPPPQLGAHNDEVRGGLQQEPGQRARYGE